MSDVLYEVWDEQPEGYVFLSLKAGGKWDDVSFKYPEEKPKIEKLLKEVEAGTDIYWCPITFFKPRRKKDYALPSKFLYADLDPVAPDTIDPRPSVAWESSPGRYQALWELDIPLQPVDFSVANRNLTYSVGADKGGWDITQVLRVPGTRNHKYKDKPEVKLLWNEDWVYRSVSMKLDSGPAEEQLHLVGIMEKYRGAIPPKISRLIQYPPDDTADRSSTLWYIEHELVKAKIPVEDIFLIIKASPWNKYRGRHDEDIRIRSEIEKVYSGKRLSRPEVPGISLNYMSLSDFMGKPSQTHNWLIQDLWTHKSNGMIAGEPKTFKSIITLEMALSVASGSAMWDQYQVNYVGPVLIIQNENADWIVQDRLARISESKELAGDLNIVNDTFEFPPNLPITLISNQGFTFDDAELREQVEDMAATTKPELIIFDPLYLMFSGDVNSAQELQPILRWLMNVKNAFNTSVLVVHHFRKQDAKRGGQRMLGSTTLHGWAESALYISERVEPSFSSRTIRIEREFRGAGVMPFLDVDIRMDDEVPYQVGLTDVATASVSITDLLSMHPEGMSIASIARELGCSRDKVAKLVTRLVSEQIVKLAEGPRNAKLVVLV